ncbi:MAG: hypothetical protein WCG47_17775, partial [Dermatophilaceae bacterium]
EQRDPEPPTRRVEPGRTQMSPPRANGQEQAHDDPGPRQMVGVRIAHVFDISQTDGKPLTDCGAVQPTLLTGQAPQYLWDGLAVQVTEAGYHLADEHLGNGANGRTDYSTRQVLIRPGLDPAQRVKTLAHDLLTAPTAWSRRARPCPAQATLRQGAASRDRVPVVAAVAS